MEQCEITGTCGICDREITDHRVYCYDCVEAKDMVFKDQSGQRFMSCPKCSLRAPELHIKQDGCCNLCRTTSGKWTILAEDNPDAKAILDAFSAPKFTLKDSGQREEFPTGSVRDTREGKGRFDLISPIALKRLAVVYERGAAKYSSHNWRLGQPLSRYLDSALRHTFQVLEGKEDEDHAAQAAWNLFAFIETQARIKNGELSAELNDLWQGAV
jgi:hypothetical protein